MRVVSRRRTLRVARELGLMRPTHPTAEGALELRLMFEQLGTTFIKLGQFLVSRPDLMPVEYTRELAKLLDHAPPVAVAEVRATIERAFDKPVDEIFASFDDAPIAAASIAQVHGVRLPSGERCVVKVRRPGIVNRVETDLQILADLARRADAHIEAAQLLQVRAIIDEIDNHLHNELDLRADAANTEIIARNLANFDAIHVPRVHVDLVTSDVFVMEYIDGVPVAAADFLDSAQRSNIAQQLLRAYIKQILLDGVYHADPHGGNFLITPAGTLVLLDFGLIGRLDEDTRYEFAVLLLALADNRADDLADVLISMSSTDRSSDQRLFHQELRRLLPRYQLSSLGQISIGDGLSEIQRLALTCRIGLPVPLALIAKTLSQVDSIARELDPDIRPFEVVKKYASELMVAQVRASMDPSSVASMTAGPALALSRLPRRIDHLLEKAERGELTIGVVPTELKEMVAAARSVTNRISISIILAATLIASGPLMNVHGVRTLFGYPALGLISLIAATTMGMVLIVSMWRTRGRR